MALRTKLLLFLLPLVIGPLLGLGWLAYAQLRSDAEANLLREMDILLEQIALSERTRRRTALANLELFSGSNLLQRFVFAPEQEQVGFLLLPLLNLFGSYHDAYPEYDEIRLLDQEGSELANYQGDARLDAPPVMAFDQYLEALRANEAPALARYMRDADGEPLLLVGRKLNLVDPVFEDNSIAEPSLRGYLVLLITPDGLKRQAAESVFGEAGRLLFTGNDGRRLFPDVHQPVLRQLDPSQAAMVQKAADTDALQRVSLVGERELLKARQLTPGLLLSAVIPEEELIDASADLGRNVLIVSVVALVLASGLLLLVVNLLVVQPVRRLERGAAAIGAGDLQVRLLERGRDELASLAKAFNRMAANLQTSQREKDSAQQEALANKQLAIDNLRKADQLKDEFLANTSHELRTPLHGIIGLAESLRAGVGGPLSPTADENLMTIVVVGRRLANLVNDILDFARLRHRDLRLQLAPVDVRGACVVACELVRNLATSKGLELINNVPDGLPLAWADENRLQQILSNLIGNSIKFTDEGWVQICASVEDAGMLAVSVCDSGPGIPPDKHATVFQSFEQLDGSASREHGGTGLGLAVTRSLVQALGGSITLESRLGAGACFIFTLPLATADVVAAASQASAGPAEPGVGPVLGSRPTSGTGAALDTSEATGLSAPAPGVGVQTALETDPNLAAIKGLRGDGQRILVVDDDPVNLRVLRNQLGLQGFVVESAGDGQEALEWFQGFGSQESLVVLLDVMMPRMNGYELCRLLRERFDENELPILFMTARTQERDVLQGFVVGGNDYLPKPFARGELIARVHTHATLVNRTRALQALTQDLEQRVAERTRALEQANAKMEQMAMCDGLTQVYNRRYLDQTLGREWRQARRQGHWLAALMIDIDFFKQYNDGCGHLQGDRCLQQVAEVLSEQARRGGDLVARYGGEEFCIIVQGDLASARVLADRIRRSVEVLDISHPASQVSDRVTVSIGVAALKPDQQHRPEDLIADADAALYQSKRSGRNRVTERRQPTATV